MRWNLVHFTLSCVVVTGMGESRVSPSLTLGVTQADIVCILRLPHKLARS